MDSSGGDSVSVANHNDVVLTPWRFNDDGGAKASVLDVWWEKPRVKMMELRELIVTMITSSYICRCGQGIDM